MKTCRLCQRSDVKFGDRRAVCHGCREKQRPKRDRSKGARIRDVAEAHDGALDFAIDVDPEEFEETPLEAAYRERSERDDRRKERKQVEALLDENKSLRARIGQLVQMQTGPEILVYKKPEHERADAVACAVASDWHVEEEVVGASVHGLNTYNLDVAKKRSERFFQNALRLAEMMAKDSKVNDLWIGFLGDFFSGHIHDELKASTLLAPADAARFVMGLFISGIDFILRESRFRIVGDMIPGNHGRMTDQVWHSDPTGTSLESFMYHAVAARYAGNPRVDLHVSEHAMVYRRFFERFNMRLIHGYEVKFGGGVGGITIPINKACAQWDRPIRADLTVMGHFHQLHDGGHFLVNGSLIGFNSYSQAIKATFEEPRQAFFLVHARAGGQKAITAPIWLDDAKSKEAA